MSALCLEVRGISKAFGGVQALADVSLSIAPGEVLALCGENGAGKSTLIRVISGSCVPDAGIVRLAGRLLLPGSVRDAESAGIAVIHQDPITFPDLSAVENIFVGRESRRLAGWLDRGAMRRAAEDLLADLGEPFDRRRPVGELTLAQRQTVAIARALARECRVLILDEPTASLSDREATALFGVIRRLQARGVSIVYVSHRLEEIFALADRVTVLRDGRVVETCAVADVDRAGLIRRMVGREIETAGAASRADEKSSVQADAQAARTPEGLAAPAPLLQVQHLSRRGVFDDISFAVHAGEVVGLAGLVGAGRSEVARAIFGIDNYDSGRVLVGGRELRPRRVSAALKAGLALVPEDRQHLGLVLSMSVGANLTLAILRSFTQLGWLSRRRERATIERLLRELLVRATGPGAPAWSLSGGNQQKLLLGKWLATRPRVLILDEPTRGVDVGAKAEVHRLIRRLAADGMATLLISSDLPEILALSDRILVMRTGGIAGELCRADATQENVLALALPDVATSRPSTLEPAR